MPGEPHSIEVRSESADRTMALGERIGRLLRAGDVVLLHGDLGAGKTCLVRGVARGMGIDPGAVNSPTFVVVNEYDAPAGRPHLVHMDAYRLGGPEDLDDLGLDESLGGGALVIEWAERVASAFESPALEIHLHHDGGDRRSILIETRDPRWAERLIDLE